ncbi:MAG: 50S ribosomal protein L23 [Planctomycetota bacterium]
MDASLKLLREQDPHRIIVRPLVTEKGTSQSDKHNVYNFEVAAGANKIEIRKAIESIFEVSVVSVRTMVRKGKLRRRGWNLYRTPAFKRALVTLKEGDRIEFI